LKDISFRPPGSHYQSLDDQALKKEEIKDFLSQRLDGLFYWVRCVERLIQEGVHQFVEVGYESTLTEVNSMDPSRSRDLFYRRSSPNKKLR